ncbi:chitin disaccharide deacetylase [Natroniella sp. ANB-PHB2]|uniref:chitin disaccharide deacetylase n=1 Tax=Natroniella sp. ANB-PHB2 TaxID=3384444 RepID=UPI0038D3C33A
MKKVIINADDFGLHSSCNQGIIKALTEGVVSSTTLMINLLGAEEAIKLAQQKGIRQMGLHLNLTYGRPISLAKEIPSLVTEEGEFYNQLAELLENEKVEEVKCELRRQIEKFLETDLELTHLDSHHHIHLNPGFKEVVAELAREYELPVRHPNKEVKEYFKQVGVVTTDCFFGDFYGAGATLKNLKQQIESFSAGTIEIMCHPGLADDKLKETSSYNDSRVRELKILTSNELTEWFKNKGVEIISFAELGS